MLFLQDSHFQPLTSCGGGCTTNLICLVRWQFLKPVSGYEGRYFVSNTGFIYSGSPLKVKRPYDDGKGYQKVDLYLSGKKKRVYMHRLVYETFVGEIEPNHEIDHHNCDRSFNRLFNLRKMSRKENMRKMLEQNPHVLNNLKKTSLAA